MQINSRKKISLMTYNVKKKSNIVICQGKNPPYPTPPQTFNGHVNHLRGEGRNGFVINVTINKMAGARSSCGGFQD